MNLVIDSGNTLAKVAVFNDDIITEFVTGNNHQWDFLDPILDRFTIRQAIISDVTGNTDKLSAKLKERRYNALIMDAATPTPLQIKYNTTQTLGSDRIAAALQGHSMFPDYHVLTIQTGTCFTYELVTPAAEYLGGTISPGIDMRFKAMHTFTAKLPLVKKKEINFLAGRSTEESILSGVMNACVAEIDGMIDQYKKQYPGIKVVMGGGDTFFFDKKLKNRIFATENLVLKGLNKVLNFNKLSF